MDRIKERELVIPTLEILSESPNGEATTTDIIAELKNRFNPTGEDAEILEGRNDTKFTQIVRNLKSHKTLVKEGLAEEIHEGFRITEAGKKLVSTH